MIYIKNAIFFSHVKSTLNSDFVDLQKCDFKNKKTASNRRSKFGRKTCRRTFDENSINLYRQEKRKNHEKNKM